MNKERVYGFLKPCIDAEILFLRNEMALSRDAAISAAAILEQRLIGLTAPVIGEIYKDELLKINPFSDVSPVFVSEENRREAADSLCVRLAQKEDVFATYPRLAGYKEKIHRNFRLFMGRFIQRYDADRTRISAEIMEGNPLGALKAFSASGADCHLHGSCSLKVVAEGGSFYYKPRDCRSDALYRELTEQFFSDITGAPAIVEMTGYGYAQEILSYPVCSEEEIRSYFENFGGLMAVFQALGSNDMHYENIVASGIHPVAVDLETIVTPLLNLFKGTDYTSIDEMDDLWRDLLYSPANTMVLPMMLQGKVQMSPLLATGEGTRSLPVYNGKHFTVSGYEDDFVKGYSRIYDRILEHRSRIKELIKAYGTMRSRYVLRASSYYAITLNQLHSPSFLNDGEKAEKELDKLSDRFSYLPVSETEALTSWEKSCLDEGDIPYFSTYADTRELYGDSLQSALASDFFDISPMEHANRSLDHMSDDEKNFELSYLRSRFSQAVDHSFTQKGKNSSYTKTCIECGEASDRAGGIFERIDRGRVTTSGGMDVFLSYDHNMMPDLIPGLRSGMQGIAFFFDLMIKTGGKQASRAGELLDACRRDTDRLIGIYEHNSESGLGNIEKGLYRGFGGILASPAFDRRHLTRILDLVRPDRYEGPDSINAAHGMAGLIIGLSRFADSSEPDDRVRQMLKLCGDTLAKHSGPVAEEGSGRRRISGFLMGEAGLGYAFSLCSGILGDKSYAVRASEAFNYELDQYNDTLKAWPDLMALDRPLIPGYSLETGAAGIGIGAALSPAECVSKELLLLAADTVISQGFLETDTLIEGNSGAALALIEISGRLNDKGYLRQAGEILDRMVKRADEEGGFRLLGQKYKTFFDPSFLNGYAGIGYVLLRYVQECET